MARTMLLHAVRRWPKAIDIHLWPYAIRMADDNMNNTPSKRVGMDNPMQKFRNTAVEKNLANQKKKSI